MSSPKLAPVPTGLFDRSLPAEGLNRAWEPDPVRFAVIGLGMGHHRAKGIVQTPGVRLVGVCDLVEDRARRTGQECGVPYSTDLKRWLEDETVEVVYVMTETGRHGEVALQALEAGKHVLTTKPMDASLAPCDRMIRSAEERGLLLAVDLDRRFQDDVLTLKRALAEGRLGRLLAGDCSLKVLRTMEYFRSNGGWRGTRRWDGGGVLSNQSVHHIDEIAFTVGIPRSVQCSLWTQTHEIEAEDLGLATWAYPDGLVIRFSGTTSYPHGTWYLSYELHGDQGAYFAASGGPMERPMTRWFQAGAWSNDPPVLDRSPWINAADNFAGALRSGAELTCSGRDGRRTQSILDAMYRSAYEAGGGWVDLAPDPPGPSVRTGA